MLKKEKKEYQLKVNFIPSIICWRSKNEVEHVAEKMGN